MEDVNFTGAELMGRSWAGFVGISLGGIEDHSFGSVLVVQDRGPYAERVGIFSFLTIGHLQRQTGRWKCMLGPSALELHSDQKWIRRKIRLA
jgi:hypothetical protein